MLFGQRTATIAVPDPLSILKTLQSCISGGITGKFMVSADGVQAARATMDVRIKRVFFMAK